MSIERVQGRVKWYDPRKGFGFATPQVDGMDVFIAAASLPPGVNKLNEDQTISYIVETSRKGPRAACVQV